MNLLREQFEKAMHQVVDRLSKYQLYIAGKLLFRYAVIVNIDSFSLGDKHINNNNDSKSVQLLALTQSCLENLLSLFDATLNSFEGAIAVFIDVGGMNQVQKFISLNFFFI